MIRDMFGDIRYKVGLHIHTSISDGRVSPEKAAEIYRNQGFDAIAITDHWKFHSNDTINGLKIISGCEYNLGASDTAEGVMHIVAVGMDHEPKFDKPISRQDIINGINDSGGLAILAHPAWSLNNLEDLKSLTGFGATEIYNTVSNVNQSSRPYSGYFVDIAANAGIYLPLIATDDAHYYGGLDDTKSYIMVKAAENSAKSIISAITKGDFYATQGPELHIKREGNRLTARCSECVMIDFLSNAAWGPDRITRGESLTSAEYEIKEHDKWVRVEVHDKYGNSAWSNIIKV